MHTESIKEYTLVGIYAPEIPEIKKIVSVPSRVIAINLAAAPTANIIRLVQGEEKPA